MNLLEALIVVLKASEQSPESEKLIRARKRVADKIHQLASQRARRKPTGLIATVIPLRSDVSQN